MATVCSLYKYLVFSFQLISSKTTLETIGYNGPENLNRLNEKAHAPSGPTFKEINST